MVRNNVESMNRNWKEKNIFLDLLRLKNRLKSDWMSARHVYEFAQREGDDFTNLEKRGIIIGVADGKLEEYVRLHDEQPQIIMIYVIRMVLENLQFLHSLLYQVIGIYCNLLSIREKKIRAYMKTRHIKSGCVLLESVRNLFQEKNFGKT